MPSLKDTVDYLGGNFLLLFAAFVALGILMVASAIAWQESGKDDQTRSRVLNVCIKVFGTCWVVSVFPLIGSAYVNVLRAILK